MNQKFAFWANIIGVGATIVSLGVYVIYCEVEERKLTKRYQEFMNDPRLTKNKDLNMVTEKED